MGNRWQRKTLGILVPHKQSRNPYVTESPTSPVHQRLIPTGSVATEEGKRFVSQTSTILDIREISSLQRNEVSGHDTHSNALTYLSYKFF